MIGTRNGTRSASPAPSVRPPARGRGNWYVLSAVVFAVAAFIVSWQWQEGLRRSIVGDQEVFVAKQAIDPGTRLDEGDGQGGYRHVELVRRPGATLARSKQTIARADQLAGRTTLYPILSGEPIYLERTLESGRSPNETFDPATPLAYTLARSMLAGGVLPPLRVGDLVTVVSFDRRSRAENLDAVLRSGGGVLIGGRVVVALPSGDRPEWVSIAVTRDESIRLTAAVASEWTLAIARLRYD